MMIEDDNDGQMIFGDLGGLKLPNICLTCEEKPRKNLTQETCPDRGSNPGPLCDRRACYRLAHSSGWTSSKFTTGVKYQFHQGIWWDQRSENPSNTSPPYIYRIHIVVHRCGASGSMRACHAAGPVGTSFLGEVFSGFFLTCKTNVGKLKAPKVPEYHLAIIIIHTYSLRAPMTWDVDAP